MWWHLILFYKKTCSLRFRFELKSPRFLSELASIIYVHDTRADMIDKVYRKRLVHQPAGALPHSDCLSGVLTHCTTEAEIMIGGLVIWDINEMLNKGMRFDVCMYVGFCMDISAEYVCVSHCDGAEWRDREKYEE